MLRIDHLLCLASGPLSSSTAVQQARCLAGPHGATVHVISYAPGGETSPNADHSGSEGPVGEATLEIHDIPVPETVAAACETVGHCVDHIGADLLVFDPSPNHTVAPSANEWVRSFADRLSCPLFAADAAPAPDAIQNILVPTDVPSPSVETLRYANALASCYEASILLLHVIETNPYVALTPVDRLALGNTPLPEHRARRQLQQFVDEHRPNDGPLRIRLAFGEPAPQIARVARQEAIDLVVLASRNADAPPNAPLGTVTDRVLRRVSLPVFLVRPFKEKTPVPDGPARET